MMVNVRVSYSTNTVFKLKKSILHCTNHANDMILSMFHAKCMLGSIDNFFFNSEKQGLKIKRLWY